MVLIIDDEIDICETIQEILGLYSIAAIVCTRPQEAQSLIQTGDFSCVITDIAMPTLNGIELSKVAKARFPDLKIICVSSYSEMMKEDLRVAGVDYAFPKPFEVKELVACVKECLRAIKPLELGGVA